MKNKIILSLSVLIFLSAGCFKPANTDIEINEIRKPETTETSYTSINEDTSDQTESKQTSVRYTTSSSKKVLTNEESSEQIVFDETSWPSNPLSKNLPVIDSDFYKSTYIENDILTIQIPETTYEAFQDYIQKLKDFGYQSDEEGSPTYYTGIKDSSWLLDAIYSQNKRLITLTISRLDLDLSSDENYITAEYN